MLDERKTAILRAMVQEYIATAQPVGSTHIANAPGVGVSSATVRNEMAVLEQEGYLVQPHTSAGRIPTDKGYRFFVDHLAAARPARPGVAQRVGDFFDTAHGRLEEMLHQTSNLLAQLTHHAARRGRPACGGRRRALGPGRRPVGAHGATSWPCCRTASVENETIECERGLRAAGRSAATAHLQPAHGRVGRSSPADPVPTATRRRRSSAAAVDALVGAGSDEPVFVGGTAVDGAGVRRGRHRAPGVAHPRAAVRDGVARARHPRPGPVRRDRRRTRCRAAGGVLGGGRARWWSTASTSAPSGCSDPPA
jgi:heat-inducible transcriptional repressor